MYRSLNQIIKGVVTVGLAALTLAPSAGAQRSAGPKQPATSEKPATTSASKPAAKAPAAKPHTNKWVFGAHTVAAPGVTVTGQDVDGTWGTSLGGGLGVMVGYELNRAVTAFGSLDVARQGSGVDYMTGSFGLVHAEIGVRAALSKTNPQMVPYLLGAIGRRAVGARVTDLEDGEVFDMSLSGTMVTFGGGLEYKVSPKLSLDGGIEFGVGMFNHVDDGDVYTISVNSSTSTRLRAGFVWRP
jgi:outer membrane protein with beta-barrel domain